MQLHTIREQLARHRPAQVAPNGYRRAAVAMILRPQPDDTEVLLIQRTDRLGDPWSGHMAFPGGREDAGDPELHHTAARETREEVGIDLHRTADLIGGLDDVQAVARDRPLSMIIRPYIYALHQDVTTRPDHREVRETVWLPLSFLTRPDAHGVYQRELNGTLQDFPAFVYQGYTIWGLTYRMLTTFLEVVR
jgi:8-oxo-dGTP pyrophosphatase MutT (NUDIX family)